MGDRERIDKNNGIGSMIRAIRRKQELTQEALANLAGLERSSVAQIERGTQMLNVRTINALAEGLGYRVVVKFVRKFPVSLESEAAQQ